jgi:hypothetical protein
MQKKKKTSREEGIIYGTSESPDVTTDALESKLWKSEFFRLYYLLFFFGGRFCIIFEFPWVFKTHLSSYTSKAAVYIMLNSDAGQKLRYLSLKECNSALTSAANIMPLKLDDGAVSGI